MMRSTSTLTVPEILNRSKGECRARTNLAGLLSPYGEFFPMMPGPVALVTMPDIDTGQRGAGSVPRTPRPRKEEKAEG